MNTQDQITVTSTVPVSAWDDLPVRQAAWAGLRDRASGSAARDGKTLTGTPETRQFTYVRVIEAADGEPQEAECTRDQAEFVKLRLSCWASADEKRQKG